MLPVGTRVGDYEIEAELGEGGMATVYRARHALLESHYALKVLDPRYRASAEARARFLDEARIQHKHLRHPNIVRVENVVATADHAALVMELVDGPSLEGAMGELRGRPDEIKRIMVGVLGGVGHAHAAGIVHRDLKPANVLLQRHEGRLFPKVTDFGIAKLSSALAAPGKKSTQGHHRMGTLGYMSPEQITRAKDVTTRSDIFSLGVMLYELATGAMPFDGDNEYEVMDHVLHGRYEPPEARVPDLDPVIAAVIRRALAVEAAGRYATCEEMAAALEGTATEDLGADADAEWDVHEPTPLPAHDAILTPSAATIARPGAAAARRSSAGYAGASPAITRASSVVAFDVRTPIPRVVERAVVPAVAGVAVWLLAMLLLGPLAGTLVGVSVGIAAGVGVDSALERRRFGAASTILIRVEAREDQRARLQALMHELGFVPSDTTEHGSMYPIEPIGDRGEARAFQVDVPNAAAVAALHDRCQRDLRGAEHYPPDTRAEVETPEGFAEFLAKLLWDNQVPGPDAHCLVRVLHWDRAP